MTVAKQFTRKSRPVPAGLRSAHFYLIADTLASYRATTVDNPQARECNRVLDDVAMNFADKLAQSAPAYDRNGNRRFDRQRFLTACGVLKGE